jgi:hypothetical protein
MVVKMGCWRWFNIALKEAGIEITDQNKDAIDKAIHEFIGEQSSYGRCSADWKRARGEIRENHRIMQELIVKLKNIT